MGVMAYFTTNFAPIVLSGFCCIFPTNCLCDVMLRMETTTLFQRRIALVWNVLQPETLLYLGRTRLFLDDQITFAGVRERKVPFV